MCALLLEHKEVLLVSTWRNPPANLENTDRLIELYVI